MAASELPEMPNGPIMELHGQRKRFHVPHGLKPLLEDMTREVICDMIFKCISILYYTLYRNLTDTAVPT